MTGDCGDSSARSSAESSPIFRRERLLAIYAILWTCRSWTITSTYGKKSVAMASANLRDRASSSLGTPRLTVFAVAVADLCGALAMYLESSEEARSLFQAALEDIVTVG